MKHVVALSGGKDSCAMALRLAEVEPREYEYVITPTGNELPEMQQHWDRLAALLGKPLTVLKPFDGDGLLAVIRQEGMIPNFRARFCTRILKIEPMQAWLTENVPAIQYVGLRADEEHRDGMYGMAEGVTQRYPLREWGWGIEEVWGYLDERGVTIPERTDCAWCFFQRLPEWKRLPRGIRRWRVHRGRNGPYISLQEPRQLAGWIDGTQGGVRQRAAGSRLQRGSTVEVAGLRPRGAVPSLFNVTCWSGLGVTQRLTQGGVKF